MYKRQRLYRSGDLARFLPDGNIQFLGRIDHQIKMRGLRLELGEVEASLRQHPVVGDCLVTVYADAAGVKKLVAYVVATPERVPGVADLRARLTRSLPEHMVPSGFVMLERLPLTANGKPPSPPKAGAASAAAEARMSDRLVSFILSAPARETFMMESRVIMSVFRSATSGLPPQARLRA